jgi:outer membrane protein
VYKFVKVVVLAMCAMMATQALAQGKIAVVDIQRAILETDSAKLRLDGLREDASYVENKKELEVIQQAGQDLLEKLQKDGAVMSADQKAAQQGKLKEKQADLKHVAGKLQAAEQQLARQILVEMEAGARTAISGVIKDEGIGLLLDAQSALHADTSYDITAKITQKLNAN